MEKLIEILKQFKEKRKETISNGENIKQWNADAVAECFAPCAKDILCKGYFLVNEKYIIDIGAIELYYHEEDGDIKDYIMYHTNAHPSKSKLYEKNHNEFPYFEFGSFNLHQSGLDITFENPDEKYRASFLIRSYRLLKTKNNEYPKDDKTPYDPCSTHIFDDMFYEGIMFGKTKIEWKETVKGKEIESLPQKRKNVSLYYKLKDKKGNDKYEKLSTNDYDKNTMFIFIDQGLVVDKDFYENNKNKLFLRDVEIETFKSGNKTYLKDTRKWQFKLKEVII